MKSTADIRVGSPWSARRNPNTPAMKFVILGFDGPEGEAKRKLHRPAHLARMEPLDAQGRVEVHPFLQVFPKENRGR